MTPEHPRRFLKSVNIALDIIDEIAKAGHPLSITEVAAHFGLSKGAVHTVLKNLEARDYVMRAPGSLAFSLGNKIWQLQGTQSANLDALINEEIAQVARLTGETTHLTTYVPQNQIIFLHRVMGKHPVQALIPIGERAPATTAASGLVLLAHQPDAEIESVLSRPLPKLTDRSIVDTKSLIKILEQIRTDGFAIAAGTNHSDILSLAVPVEGQNRGSLYAVGCYGPEYRFSEQVARECIPRLQEAAERISRKLQVQ